MASFLQHILLVLALLLITPALADDSLLKSIMNGSGDPVVLADGGPAHSIDPSTPTPLPYLNAGDLCTDDARCAFIEPVGAGTGRAERFWPGNDQAVLLKTQAWLAALPSDLSENDPRINDNGPPPDPATVQDAPEESAQ